MHVCKCGGVIRQHELTNNREAWTCGSCGRYEAIERGARILQFETGEIPANNLHQSPTDSLNLSQNDSDILGKVPIQIPCNPVKVESQQQELICVNLMKADTN